MTIPIVEIFGPTIQGEGVATGMPVVFVRVGGCDYRCKLCDTWYAVDKKKYGDTWAKMEPSAIVTKIMELSPTPITVVFSGGNPALYKELGKVILVLKLAGYPSTCETQASLAQDWFADLSLLTLSPKPPSMSGLFIWDDFYTCLSAAGGIPVEIKIPVFTDEDLDFAGKFQFLVSSGRVSQLTLSVGNPYVPDRPAAHPIPPTQETQVMSLLENYRNIVNKVLTRGWNHVTIKPQMHVLLWGNQKGV